VRFCQNGFYRPADRLLSLALPRIRDFRGLSPDQFDGNGNYTFGLNEQSMFREIDMDRVDRQRGMDITVVTTARTDDEGRALLRLLGFPFRTDAGPAQPEPLRTVRRPAARSGKR
jgi:large subunit ribosomal protein L5